MVDILQNNTNLYDPNDKTKMRYIEVGEPEGNPLPTPPKYPAMWVTNSRTLETITRKGINDSNHHSYLLHDVNYLLKMMVVAKDSIVAEKNLDDFQKTVMETLEADIALLGTVWSGATAYVVGNLVSNDGKLYQATADNTNQEPPNASFWTAGDILPDDTWPDRVETFRQELDGQGIRGKTLTWHLQFTSN